MVYLSNAFSLQMQGENDCTSREISREEAVELMTAIAPGPYIDRESEKEGTDTVKKVIAKSVVGHDDIARVLSALLGFKVLMNRESISLEPGDKVIVGQFSGGRLPEGCKTLPLGFSIRWYLVECHRAGKIDRLESMEKDLFHAAAETEFGPEALLETAEKYFPQYFTEDAFE